MTRRITPLILAAIVLVSAAAVVDAAPPGPVHCLPPDPYRTSTQGLRFSSDRSGNLEVYETTSDPNRTPRDLSNDPGADYKPSAQGGAMLVAYVSERDGNPEIYCTMVGYTTANLTQDPAVDTDPSMTGSGGRVVFQSDRSGDFDIWMMNSDGSGLTQLTSDPATDVEPSISRDGSKIAFVSDRTGNDDVYVMNADESGTPVDVTNDPASDRNPVFSDDKTLIAFDSDRDGNRNVYWAPSTGGAATRVTDNPASDTEPAFSPNGEQIAFTSDRSGNGDIWITQRDGSGTPINVTHDPAADSDPDWKPVPPPTFTIGLTLRKARDAASRTVILGGDLYKAPSYPCDIGRKTLLLQRARRSASEWREVAATQTETNGDYRFKRHPKRTWYWQTVFLGSSDCQATVSNVLRVRGFGTRAHRR